MTEFQYSLEWIGGILLATLVATVVWTLAYLYWPHRRMVDEDGETVPAKRSLKAMFHPWLKTHRLRDQKELLFMTGTERNYRFHFHSKQQRTERVIGSAIRHPDGLIHVVIEPGRHHHVIRYMSSLKRAGLGTTRDQGFITNQGRYVSRLEGLAIAQLAKQIKRKTPPAHKLFSEDLW
ncbi:hypothetical protein AWB81_04209 [Caballeronia arationis]|uniref:hypothetical protein n=1 Tax=Caballeronia arationis TaxID=1777142 RepID=UPI00074B5D45|nr:hypothetical protein [Caballeronia arationis]SAK83442.1 hypothetical protein AWB81_04209 [Caballeronia arationis]